MLLFSAGVGWQARYNCSGKKMKVMIQELCRVSVQKLPFELPDGSKALCRTDESESWMVRILKVGSGKVVI